MRYRLYRGHKYVSYVLNELEMLIAKTNFNSGSEVKLVRDQLTSAIEMLKFHAKFEDKAIHELLRNKGSKIHLEIESDHQNHDKIFEEFLTALDQILDDNTSNKIELGYQFYLEYRLFVADNLYHMHKEETVIMEELQKLYKDDDLKVDFGSYAQMTPEQVVHMIEVLFPHMDVNDHFTYLKDIKECQPEKFNFAWKSTQHLFSADQLKELRLRLGI